MFPWAVMLSEAKHLSVNMGFLCNATLVRIAPPGRIEAMGAETRILFSLRCCRGGFRPPSSLFQPVQLSLRNLVRNAGSLVLTCAAEGLARSPAPNGLVFARRTGNLAVTCRRRKNQTLP